MTAPLAPDYPPTLGRYQLLGRVAQGGMAELFLARVVEPDGKARAVAIKRVLPQFAKDLEFVTMFLDEANLTRRLDHPNITRVEELGNDDGNLYLAMEYLNGESTNDVLKALAAGEDMLSASVVAYIIAEACAGLSHAHQMVDNSGDPLLLVHRDISPGNLFITYEGRVKVLDFGIASAEGRMTETRVGQVKGKAAYMSPEHVRGEVLDARSDLFSLGVVMWELTMKSRLWKRKNELATSTAVLSEAAPRLDEARPGFPADLAAVCAHALAKDRDDRYISAEEMEAALRALIPADADPAAELRALMTKLFAARITEKSKTFLDASRGANATILSLVPPQDETLSGFKLPHLDATTFVPGSQSSSRRPALLALAVALAFLVGAAAWAFLR